MQVNGLRKAFGGQTVLDGVDLELREGEVVLLRGENGSGKTTLLNILTGNMEPDAGEIRLFVNSHTESFRFPRRWWQEINPWDHFTPERVATEGVGRTWQDARLFGTQTLLDNLAVAKPGHPGETPWRIFSNPRLWHKAEATNRLAVQALLEKIDLGDRADSSADMISLGQTKRIAFARCAHADTKIVFLDEPLAGLDQKGAASIITVLRDLASVHRLTLVIVEHVFNIPVILDFASTVWTLADGRLLRESVDDVRADPTVNRRNELPALILQMASPEAVVTQEPLPRGATLTRVSRPEMPREPLLVIKGLLAFRGHRLVVGEREGDAVKGLDFTLNKGDLVFIQAPNGWGKTSLLETLAGILPSAEGSILIDGTPIDRLPPWERRRSGLVVVPARDNVFNSLTINEFYRIGTSLKFAVAQPESSSNSLRNGSRMMSSLSGGERKRLVLDTAHKQDAKVKVWDEPFSSLDAQSVGNCFGKLVPRSNTAALVLVPGTQHTAEEA